MNDTILESKLCNKCGDPFYRRSTESITNWSGRKYCSRRCNTAVNKYRIVKYQFPKTVSKEDTKAVMKDMVKQGTERLAFIKHWTQCGFKDKTAENYWYRFGGLTRSKDSDRV
jgi:hypothetical protein